MWQFIYLSLHVVSLLYGISTELYSCRNEKPPKHFDTHGTLKLSTKAHKNEILWGGLAAGRVTYHPDSVVG